MDSVMMRQFDPTSSMFQTSATRNLSQVGMSSLRNQKEVAPQPEEERNSIMDDVHISMPDAEELKPEDAVDNAANSGALSDIADELDDDENEVRERHNNAREEALENLLQGGLDNDIQGGSQKIEFNGITDIKDVNHLKDMDDPQKAVREILKDIPQNSLQPATNIVCSQVQNGRPAEALVQLKPVEGVNAIDFQAAPQISVLDIHDTGNKPMLEDSGADLAPDVKQNLAREQMDNLINNLPDDRKSSVNELRSAVNAWASNSGVDGTQEFAKQLHELAKGWDDETLMAATGAYNEASVAMNEGQGA